MTDLVGHTLSDRYQVEALLGRGGMAEVYKAWDTRRQYDVAIKVIREDLAEDVEFMRRFRNEGRALAELSHANIVRFYSFERDGHLAFIVMDYVPGVTLRRRILDLDGAPLPMEEVISIVHQVSAALYYAHKEGVIHRDVKPGNIIIRPDGQAMLSDFGIAKAADATTVTTLMPGTPAYMSPEQCLSQPLDPRSDIYSLGVMVYEMLAGRRPFVGGSAQVTGTNSEKVRWEHLKAEPPPLRQFNANISPTLETAVLKCLKKNLDERFASVLDFLQAFDQALGITGPVAFGQPATEWHPAQSAASTSVPVTPASVSSSPAVSQPVQNERQKKQRWMGIGLVIVVVLLLMAIGGILLRPNRPKPAQLAADQQQVVTVNALSTTVALLTVTAQAQEQALSVQQTVSAIRSVEDAQGTRVSDIATRTASAKIPDTPAPQATQTEAATLAPSPTPGQIFQVLPTAAPIFLTDWELAYFKSSSKVCKFDDQPCWHGEGSASTFKRTGIADLSLLLNNPIYVDPAWANPHLVFWHTHPKYQPGYVRIKKTGGKWEYIKTLNGNMGSSWIEENVDISAYKGENILLEFVSSAGVFVLAMGKNQPNYWDLQFIRIVPDYSLTP